MESAAGAFSVALCSLSWRPDVATSVERQIWVCVHVMLAQDQSLERVWFAEDDGNCVSKSVSISTECIGQSLPLEYKQSSRPVHLSLESVTELVQTKLLLSLYSGTYNKRSSGVLLGTAKISMRTALLGQTQHQVDILSSGEIFTVHLDVHCDVGLADFMLGARVLQVLPPAVVNLPAEWIAADCVTNEDALAFCAGEQNSACYELDITLPRLDVQNASVDVTTLKGGKLSFQPAVSNGTTDKTDVDIDPPLPTGDQERPATSVSVLSGEWGVRFPETSMISMLYLQSSVERLVSFLAVEKHVSGVLRRSPAGKAIDTVTAEITLSLHELLRPGTSQIVSRGMLAAINPVPRALIEQELAGAVSNDDKKKFQAALADYENTVQQAASLTTAVIDAGTQVEISIEVVQAPLILQPPQALEGPSKSVSEMIPGRDLSTESEDCDVYTNLRTEIRLVVASLLREYEDAFRNNSDKMQGVDDYAADSLAQRDEKKQTLIYRLNTQGVYHSFKESLKKQIVPVVRECFAHNEVTLGDGYGDGQVHTDEQSVEEKKKEQFGQLYTLLMQEVNALLHDTFYSDSSALLEKAHAGLGGRPSLKGVESVLEILRLKTVENEVSGDFEKSELLHLDRIAYTEQHAAHLQAQSNSHGLVSSDTGAAYQLLMGVWYDYARFCIAQKTLDKAGAALQQCLRLDPHAVRALVALVAVQCELQDFTRAESFVKSAVVEAHACAQSIGDNADYRALAHALLAFIFSEFGGKDPTGNLAMFELLKAQQILQSSAVSKEASCVSAVWIVLAEHACECKLWRLTQRSLELADRYMKARDVISVELRVLKRAMEAELCLRESEGDEDSRIARAVKLLEDALEIDPSHPVAWFTLAKVYLRRDTQPKTAIECLQRALAHREALKIEAARLDLYLRLALALLNSSQFEAAEMTFLLACDEFRVASCWLGVGIASLRQEKWDRARTALAEANRLDGSNPVVCGYLALLSLTEHAPVTARDEKVAQQFVAQALRHNLSSPALLRELSNAFVAIDRLESAEKLLRRSLACQDSSLARKTLADVLAAQNCAEDALRQYMQSLEVTEDVEERCVLLERCAQLLTTLGRPEEANEYRTMAQRFHVGNAT